MLKYIGFSSTFNSLAFSYKNITVYFSSYLQEASPFQIPIVVRNIIGKECTFQLKLTATDYEREQFTVTKVTTIKTEEAIDPKAFNNEENLHATSTSTETNKKRNTEETVESDSLDKTNAGTSTSTRKKKLRKLSDENNYINN